MTTMVYSGSNLKFTYDSTGHEVSALAINNDFVAIANSNDNVDIFELDTWNLAHTTTDSYYKYTDVKSLALSPDNMWLACGAGYYIDFITVNPWKLDQTKYQDQY